MKITKVFKAVAKLGGKIADIFEDVVDFADQVIHRKEYEKREKRRKTVWTVILAVAGGIIGVLLFPYRVIVKRNGDFEIRSLLIRVYRHTRDYEIPEGGSEDFEIAEAAEESDELEA